MDDINIKKLVDCRSFTTGHNYSDIISLDNLLLAWQEFIVGKKNKKDVQDFSRNLFDNILSLHEDLARGSYIHGGYHSFYVNDPKRRHIHKASVRDRLLHHAVYRILYPFFDRTFIADSFSCRLNKGTHKAISRFRVRAHKISANHTRSCWVLKCDVRKFFASIDHGILIGILKERIADKNIIWLLENIIGSYKTEIATSAITPPRNDNEAGLPLGNLTSQLFANIYMNEFDQWVKHKLKTKYYIRYADDFVFLSEEKQYLKLLIPAIENFLKTRLKLILHPDKLVLKTTGSGVDFLGWINFCDYHMLRNTTRRRMMRRIADCPADEMLRSYFGLLKYGNTNTAREELMMRYWLLRNA